MNRRNLYNKFNGHCAYCGKRIEYDDMTIDHINPQSNGGKNTDENLFPTCQLCNNQKGDKSIDEYRKFISSIFNELDEFKQYRLALRYGMIKECRNKNIQFYFEDKDSKEN